MRHVILLAGILVLALASLAFAQVERDPASRHSSGTESAGSTARPFMPEPPSPAAELDPAPTPPGPAAELARAARSAGRSINAAAAQALLLAVAPPARLAAEAEPPAELPEALAPLPEPVLHPAAGPAPVPESTALEPVTTPAPAPGTLAELAQARAAELEAAAAAPLAVQDTPAPEPPDLSEPPAGSTPQVDPAPASPAAAAASPVPEGGGRRLVPNRRRQQEELLRGRDGGSDSVVRSQPADSAQAAPDQPTAALRQPEAAALPRPAVGTSLAQITGDPGPGLQLNAMLPSPGLAPDAASAAQATAGFIAPAPGPSAPVALVLPTGAPRMPGYDVPASLKTIARGNPKQKLIALTFDDGPHPEYTSQLLAVLDYYHVKATFFCVGVQVQKYPQWVKMMNQQGHEVANHTYDHFRLPKLPVSEKIYQIDEYQRLIESLTGVTPRFLRPPGGQDDKETAGLLAQRHMVMAMWDVAINDTSHGKLEQDLLSVSLKKVRPGSVLLAHDGIQATIDMLPELIESLQRDGYRLVTLSELAANK